MEKLLLEISSLMREQVNIVEINKDLAGEFSKTRLDLRTDAINKAEKIIADLRGALKFAERQLEQMIATDKINNDRITTWRMPSISTQSFNPPAMVCETIGSIQVVARKINHLEEAGPDLCFMSSINRFAIRFAGQLLVANIGNIFDICSDPERVRECRFSNENYLPSSQSETKYRIPKCSKSDGDCRFYHNPLVFPSSKEPRNYFSTCGYYVAPNSENANNANYLRFGSRAYLEQDIKRLLPEEVRRFEDYVGHLVLCLIILKRSRGNGVK